MRFPRDPRRTRMAGLGPGFKRPVVDPRRQSGRRGPLFISLLVALDDFGWTHLRLVGVVAELAQGASLAKEIPTLIELDAKLFESRLRFAVEVRAGVERVLFVHEVRDGLENALIRRLTSHGASAVRLVAPAHATA